MVALWIVASFLVVAGGLFVASKSQRRSVVTAAQSITGLALASLVAAVLCGLIIEAIARDVDGRHAASPLKPWFDSLRSGRGPCCSDADGYALSDVDWDSSGGHYRVRIPRWRFEPTADAPSPPAGTEMVWVEVDDDAVITEPNRAGRTMVWPIWGQQGPTIRCFMPGSMT